MTTKAVAEPLKKAQEAMKNKQWDAALSEIKKAQASEKKTPFEAYQIDEFLSYVLIQQKKFAEATPVFERMLNSGFMPPEQVDERTKTVAQLYFQIKDYKKSAEWAKKWLEKHPGKEDMSVLLGQSYYVLNDYKNAATMMLAVANAAEKGGRTPAGELAADRAELVVQARQQGRHRGGAEEARALLPEGRVLGEPARHLSAQGQQRPRDARLLPA